MKKIFVLCNTHADCLNALSNLSVELTKMGLNVKHTVRIRTTLYTENTMVRFINRLSNPRLLEGTGCDIAIGFPSPDLFGATWDERWADPLYYVLEAEGYDTDADKLIRASTKSN